MWLMRTNVCGLGLAALTRAADRIQPTFHVPDSEEQASVVSEEGRRSMRTNLISFVTLLHKDETGQGLVEYVLIIALVAFAAAAGMSTLASYLNSAFTAVGSVLGKYIS
jgi:pilus assembly protein Flp/PilA